MSNASMYNTYTYEYVCIYTYTQIQHICIQIWHVQKHPRIQTHTHTHTHTNAYLYLHLYVSIYRFIYTRIHARTHARTHTHTHTHLVISHVGEGKENSSPCKVLWNNNAIFEDLPRVVGVEVGIGHKRFQKWSVHTSIQTDRHTDIHNTSVHSCILYTT